MSNVQRGTSEQERQRTAPAQRKPSQAEGQAPVSPETNSRDREQQTGLVEGASQAGISRSGSVLPLLLELVATRTLLRFVSPFHTRRKPRRGWARSAWASAAGAVVGGLAVRRVLGRRPAGSSGRGFLQRAQRGVSGGLGALAMTLHSDSLAVGSAVAALESNPIARRVERPLAALVSRTNASNGITARTARASVTIGKSAAELHRAWREPDVIRQILGDLVQAAPGDGAGPAWSLRLPQINLPGDAHVVEDRAGELLRWRSLPGAELRHEGSLELRAAPGQRGTELTLQVRFSLPEGVAISGAIPDLLARRALRTFKSLVETGEVPTIAPQPAGRPGRA